MPEPNAQLPLLGGWQSWSEVQPAVQMQLLELKRQEVDPVVGSAHWL
jgi:hypothetical protein